MRLKVGITVVGGDKSVRGALWSYGIGQNVGYLARTLQRLASVEEVVLVAGPPGGDNVLTEVFGLKIIQLSQAITDLDMIIELGSRALTPDDAATLRSHGGRLVSYMAGNAVVNNFEALVLGASNGDVPILSGFDAVWITPQHWHMCRGHAAMIRSDLVIEVPHVWSPYAIDSQMAQTGVNPFWRPREGGSRLGSFEPNVNSIKTFHLPLFSAEEAYRADPTSIHAMLLFNTLHLRDNSHMLSILSAIELGKDKKVFLEGRWPLIDVMGKHIDMVVSHQWENNLNYLYWDLLYLGWPLVHNSEALGDVGYPYESFDPQSGGQAILRARSEHERSISQYRDKAAKLLDTFSPANAKVLDGYQSAISATLDRKPV